MQLADLFFSVRTEGVEAANNKITQLGNQMESIGAAIGDVGRKFTDIITGPILDFMQSSIKTSATFEQQMSRVSAVTDATGKDFNTLKSLAIDMGSKTSKTATEAAQAIEYMGLAGWDLRQIQEGLEPILRASEAGMMDLGLTSDLVTDSMSALGIGTKDLGRYLDVAAMAQKSSNQSMRQFLEAMVISGGTFKNYKVDLEEAGALLGILANRGYKGSEAGTALNSVIANLTAKSGDSSKAMKDLGIKLYDAKGNFVGITNVLQQLNKKFATMTDEQRNTYKQMIGGKMRVKELNALLNGTSKELGTLTNKLYNADGSLSAMAKTMQNNLMGKITKLKSVFEGIAIQIGDMLLPVIGFFVDKLQLLGEWFFNLEGPIKSVIVILGLLLASIGPIITVIGTVITAFGGLVIAISGLFAAITTLGLPILAAVAVALAGIPVVIAFVVANITIFIGSIVALVAKLGFLSNAIDTIKALLSGDFTKMFSILKDKLGMNEREASKLAGAFAEMYRKAQIVISVIRDNLGPILSVIKDKIVELATGGFDKLNGSTKTSQNFFVNFVQTVVSWGEKLFGYLYKVFDEFGLIPNKLKFANNQIAAQFVDLDGKVSANLDNILNSQYIFGQNLTKENFNTYNKKVNDTKVLMDKELNLVVEQLNKRKTTELNSLQELFNSSAVLTSTEEAKRIEKVKQHYFTQQQTLQNNNTRIKEIMTLASNEKRALTEYEVQTINNLRRDSANMSIQYISTSEAEQIRIMEEAKNTKTAISKQEALNIITQANRAYDAVVSKANQQKNKKINTIIQQRDGTHAISKDEANKMIREAQREADTVTQKARKTRDDTISAANKKAGGVISAAEREKRETSSQADKIKAALNKVWNDIKKSLPSKTSEALKAVTSAIIANKDKIVGAAFKVGAALVGALINGINSKIGELVGKIANLASKMTMAGTIPKFAEGVRNFGGGLALVGEQGPELVTLPRGSSVYTASQTRRMLPTEANNIYGSSYNQEHKIYNIDKIVIDAKNVKEFNDVVNLMKNMKVEYNTRRY